MLEMMGLAEEGRHISGERRYHPLALFESVLVGDQRAIFAEARQAQGAQAFRQSRIDESGFGFGNEDARLGVQGRRDLLKVAARHFEFALSEFCILVFGIAVQRREGQAASLSAAGTTPSSATKLIIRPSMTKTPRTKVAAK